MPAIWTCPRGHQWENTSSTGSAACPVCGAVPVGPLVKPNLAPGNDPEGLAETRQEGDRDILPFGLADAPARNAPPTKKNPLNLRPTPVKGNLDDTLLPTKMVRPPADEQLDETILRPMPRPPLPASEPPPPAPAAKGCWATASALILAATALAATAVAAAR